MKITTSPDKYTKILWKYDDDDVIFVKTDPVSPFIADIIKKEIHHDGYTKVRHAAAIFTQSQLNDYLANYPHLHDTCFVGDVAVYQEEIDDALTALKKLAHFPLFGDKNAIKLRLERTMLDFWVYLDLIQNRRDFLKAFRPNNFI